MTDSWDFDHRPRRLRVTVIALAVVIVLVHVAWAFVLVRGCRSVRSAKYDPIRLRRFLALPT